MIPNGTSSTGPGPRALARRPGLLARLFGHHRGAVQYRAQGPDQGWTYGSGYGYGTYGYRDTPYTGASWIRKQLSNWLPIRAAADAELLSDQGTLVARSRDLDRNTGIAAGAIQTTLDNVVGSNLRLSCWPDYRALNQTPEWAEAWGRSVESLWKTWADTTAVDVANKLTFTGMTTLVFRSVLQNGEALALPLWMDRPDLSRFKTCVQLVDPDRLSNPGNMTPTLCLRGGVEMDNYGRPLAYHVRKISTWPAMFFPAIGGIAGEWECIPATTDWGRKRILHVYTQDRVDQTRGKPILAPVIEQFRMLDAYQRAELASAIVNALVAGVIETPLDPGTLAEMVGGDPNGYLAAKNEYRVQLEGGSFIPLYPGDKMTPFAPDRPAPQFAAFSEFVLRQIGVSMGLPYEQLMKDYSKTNYSSARAALLESWRYFTTRRSWLTTYWAQPVYELWFEEAVNLGLIEAPDYYNLRTFYTRAKWIGPGRGWIDPVKEAEAAQIRMSSGISTLEAECAEQGLDYNDVIDQRRIEKQRLQEAGLWVEPPPPKPFGFPAQPAEAPVREQV
jgi:lambda family phage portal protein